LCFNPRPKKEKKLEKKNPPVEEEEEEQKTHFLFCLFDHQLTCLDLEERKKRRKKKISQKDFSGASKWYASTPLEK
jgi:hypothetical protein